MMIFGVAIAPLAEEMLFRGFLYPVLDRWLQTLFMTPRQVRRGCLWILIMAGWGYVEHRLPLAVVGPAGGCSFSGGRGAGGGAKFEVGRETVDLVLLPASTTVAWGLAARRDFRSCLRGR